MLGLNSNIGWFGKTFVLIFLAIAFFLFGYFLASVLGIPLFGINIFSQPETANSNINYLKFLQSILSIFMFIIPPIVFWIFFSDNAVKALNLNKIPNYKTIILSLAIIMISLPFINLLSEINSNLKLPESLSQVEKWMKDTEQANADLTNKFLKVDNVSQLIINILIMAMIPAIGEEMFFRGCLQKIFTGKNHKTLAVWITAFFFSAFHLQFYGFLPRFMLGAMFGFLLIWTRSLWIPIISHFFNNFCAVLGVYLINKNNIPAELDTVGASNDSWYIAAASLIICIILMIKIKNFETKNE